VIFDVGRLSTAPHPPVRDEPSRVSVHRQAGAFKPVAAAWVRKRASFSKRTTFNIKHGQTSCQILKYGVANSILYLNSRTYESKIFITEKN